MKIVIAIFLILSIVNSASFKEIQKNEKEKYMLKKDAKTNDLIYIIKETKNSAGEVVQLAEYYLTKENEDKIRITSYEEGKKVQSSEFKNQKMDGKFVIFFKENGKEKWVSRYKEGKRNGESIVYSALGKVITVENYKADKLDGIAFEYYEEGEGKLKEEFLYKEGKLMSLKKYNEDGKLILSR